jgi:hypothetical protein
MNATDKPKFMQLLAETLASYGKPLPEPAIIKVWLAKVELFAFPVIEAAMQAYCDENGEFAPVAAGIAMRCRLMDGRPGAEEAWAIAVTSQDEGDTVVWTAECAQAFALARPILDLGDEVGARMAFKEAYARLVAEARAARQPATWSASIGWDLTRRAAVLGRASVAGLLPAPTVAALLPAPEGAPAGDDKARAQLAGIKQMLAEAAALREVQLEAEHERRIEAERAERAALQRRVDNYFQKAGRPAGGKHARA